MTFREPPIPRHVFRPLFLSDGSARATSCRSNVMRIGHLSSWSTMPFTLQRRLRASRVSEEIMNATFLSEVHVPGINFWAESANLAASDFGARGLSDGERTSLAAPVDFDYDFEQEFARTLDDLCVQWEHKPRTFAIEWDENGTFVDSFTPSFFLPARDLYVELVAPGCRLSSERVRKAGLLRYQYPAVRIEVLPAPPPYQAVERLSRTD
jgi:hypothetical protein